MILSKQNLLAYHVAKLDEDIPALGNVYITSDGSTIASNGQCIIAVSPVSKEIEKQLPIKNSGPIDNVPVSLESIKEVVKNIPKDTLFNGLLEYCDLDTTQKKFTINDSKRGKTIECKFYHRAYISFKKLFSQINLFKPGKRIVLNRKRLKNVLDVIDKICPDTSDQSPVFLDFTSDNNIILRGVNYKTKQRVLALMTSYKNIEGQWLEPTNWEIKLCQKKQAIKRKSSS